MLIKLLAQRFFFFHLYIPYLLLISSERVKIQVDPRESRLSELFLNVVII